MDRTMKEGKLMTMVPQRVRTGSAQEWLGAESHLPNLNAELRRRAPRHWKPALPLLAGALFLMGAAVGSVMTRVLNKSKRST